MEENTCKSIEQRLQDIEEPFGQANAHLKYVTWLLDQVLAVLEILPWFKKNKLTIIH